MARSLCSPARFGWGRPLWAALGLSLLASGAAARDSPVDSSCTFAGKRLYGKIELVDAFPDVKVQVVSAFPDLRVKLVSAFPDRCGEWKLVTAFPDTRVQVVTAFPDVRIQYVESFPGIP